MTTLLIATPVDNAPQTATVTYGYHRKVRELERGGAVVLPSEIFWSDDLGRGRSRAVRIALESAVAWEWLLWWDEDVYPEDTGIVPRMIQRADEQGYNIIGAPYPRKRIKANFPYKPLERSLIEGRVVTVDDVAEVDWLAFGFMLTRRSTLQRLTDIYREDEWWYDDHDQDKPAKSVALFRPLFSATVIDDRLQMRRALLSEDYSFCVRARETGERIGMYVGEGSPLGHVGGHIFTGTRDELGEF